MVKLLRNDHTSTLHFTKISKTHNSKFKLQAGVNCLLEWLTREEKDFGVRHWTLRLQHGKRNYSISYKRVAARLNFYVEGTENQCYTQMGRKFPKLLYDSMFVTSYVFIFLNVSYISNSISLETLPPKSNFIQTEITHVVSRNIVDLYE